VKKRRIAVVASTFGVGGAEIVTGNVLRRLPRDRFEIRLFFLHDAGSVGRDLFAEGFEGAEHLCTHRRDVGGALRLARCFGSFRPGLLWSLDHMDAMWLGKAAALLARVPATVIASHSTGLMAANGVRRPSFGTRERVLVEFVTRLVAVSRTHARYLSGITGLGTARIAVIENGIDLDAWPVTTEARRSEARRLLSIGADEHVVSMVAALRPEKAHETLLDAVAMLNSAGRKLRVLLAGDGPRRGILRRHAQELGIADQVEFLGLRRDVARLLHASDVVVLPSHDVVETLPLSILEAMASGTPVVASSAGSVPDVVTDGETGLLIAPGSAHELAAALVATLDDGAAATRRAALARARVETYYSVNRTTAGYARLFDQVMAA
jgi:glycosyltransferase involved in cell wall biosynthesis